MAKRLPYEPPRIEQLQAATVGKHRLFDLQPGEGFEEPHDPQTLMQQFGSPLFVLSEGALRARLRGFRDTFSAPGIQTVVAYSYKTNYLPALCSILHEEGAWAEVVSGMEFELARALGAPGAEIIFNGPYKRLEELERAITAGALVNLDGFDEIERMAQAARNVGQTARVGIRVNFKYGAKPWTRFGFSYDEQEARKALERIADLPELRLEALHNHSGTFQLDHKIYARAIEVLLDLQKQARGLGLSPYIIDLGGGYPSSNRLKPEFDLPGGSTRGGNLLAPFGEAVLRPLQAALDLFERTPILVLEPGRSVVDACMRLLCSVVSEKRIAGRGRALVVDAGVNILPTAYWYDHPLDTPLGAGRTENVDVFGPLCMQIDVVRENVMLPDLHPGDPLVIDNVGAYTLTQSMQFIQPRPAVVLLGPDGPEVIRRAERWQDIFALDTVPQRLRRPGGTFQ